MQTANKGRIWRWLPWLVVPACLVLWAAPSLTQPPSGTDGTKTKPPPKAEAPPDAVAEAQTPKEVPVERPEQKKTEHDLSDIFAPDKAQPSTEALMDDNYISRRRQLDFAIRSDARTAFNDN